MTEGAKRSKPRIGVLVDRIEDRYQNDVCQGVWAAAGDLGADVIAFVGGRWSAQDERARVRNRIYDLASSRSIDGLVVLSGPLATDIGSEAFAKACKRYEPLPMCSVAVDLPGVPSVVVDNATGMKEAVEHLIFILGFSRIAFIRGPEENDDATGRYRAYMEALEDNDLEHDPSWVAQGHFTWAGGMDAIRVLYDERKVEVDAIVASSDPMALGAMQALEERGIRVPDDVGIVGFDDVEEARFNALPLTTVRQPVYELGRQAVRNVLAQLDGQSPETRTVLHTKLVARRSCGFFSGAVLHRERGRTTTSPGDSFDTALGQRRPIAVADMARSGRAAVAGVDGGWEERLFESCVAELRRDPAAKFLRRFDDLLSKSIAAHGDVGVWQDVVSAMRRHVLPCLEHDADRRANAEDLFHEACVLAGRAAERAQAQGRVEMDRLMRALSDAGQALMGSEDLDALWEGLHGRLSPLGIATCFVALDKGEPERGQAEVVFAHGDGLPADVLERGPYPADSILPEGVLDPDRRVTLVVQPLFFKQRELGFVVLELGPRPGVVYEGLRAQISAAIDVAQRRPSILPPARSGH